MSDLSIAAVITGAAGIAAGLLAAGVPGTAKRCLERFSRSAVAAWILTAVDMAWAGWLLYHATFLSDVPWLQRLIPFLFPIFFVLVVFFMDELLAARALGALLLLLPNIVLEVARWHESQWRLVMTVLAYLWVVAGMILVLSPYQFRKTVALLAADVGTCRATGISVLVAGTALVGLGLFVY